MRSAAAVVLGVDSTLPVDLYSYSYHRVLHQEDVGSLPAYNHSITTEDYTWFGATISGIEHDFYAETSGELYGHGSSETYSPTNQTVEVNLQGVPGGYDNSYVSPTRGLPTYCATVDQWYYFKVTGGNPGDVVDLELTANVEASGTGDFDAAASMSLERYRYVTSWVTYNGVLFGEPRVEMHTNAEQLMSVEATGGGTPPAPFIGGGGGPGPGVGLNPGLVPHHSDEPPAPPTATLVSGDSTSLATFKFQVIVGDIYPTIHLSTRAYVYDQGQNNSTAHALVDPVITVSPSTPNYQNYSVSYPVVAAVPEIDPAGWTAVLGVIGGSFGLLERRRRRPRA